MTMSEIKNVVVVGAGAMGSQIGLVCALAGYSATITDIAQGALDRAETGLRQRMTRDVEKGRRTPGDVEAAFGRLSFSTDLRAAATNADFVIEAAVEKLDVKRALFADLDRVAPPHAILATNSSSIVSSRIADATGRPDRVCNVHFFNPALVMKCVEVVRGPDTSDDTVATAVELARRLGKTPVVLDREIPGFIANRILGAVRDEAIFLLENGIAIRRGHRHRVPHRAWLPDGPVRADGPHRHRHRLPHQEGPVRRVRRPERPTQ